MRTPLRGDTGLVEPSVRPDRRRTPAGGRAVTGLVLAAGAGLRFGRPKALVGTWLADRVNALGQGGCSGVVVVLGAQADRALERVPPGAAVVVADDWAEGMGASLRAGLREARSTDADAVLVALVDTPGLTPAIVARVIAGGRPPVRSALVQASYDGRAAHPVLLGRSHWEGVMAVASGDRGARDYLVHQDVSLVECGDLGDGRDVDHPGTRCPDGTETGHRVHDP